MILHYTELTEATITSKFTKDQLNYLTSASAEQLQQLLAFSGQVVNKNVMDTDIGNAFQDNVDNKSQDHDGVQSGGQDTDKIEHEDDNKEEYVDETQDHDEADNSHGAQGGDKIVSQDDHKTVSQEDHEIEPGDKKSSEKEEADVQVEGETNPVIPPSVNVASLSFGTPPDKDKDHKDAAHST